MLYEVAGALRGSRIGVGAQNAFWEDAGAFTGEISPGMLAGWCRILLVGHSERRHIFHESDEDTHRKLLAGLHHRLHVILAIGETLEENEAHRTDEVITRQLRVALQEVEGNLAARVSLAYEPVWAIGTGKAATPEYANEIMGRARQWLAAERSPREASAMRILYGGSVTPANALSLMEQPEIDGALVGGASLKADQFTAIAKASAEVATRPPG
jgi:triosephosphate isomerase